MAAFRVREATEADNAALIALAEACPMEGDVGLGVSRAPDFFALNRLEGECWRVGVAENAAGDVTGCVAVARRTAYLNGAPGPTAYASDLKVYPEHRGNGTADALIRYAAESSRALGGDRLPILVTILAGNRPMERLAHGPRGLPRLARFATIRTHSIPLLWRRRRPEGGLRITPAQPEDLEEMITLWFRMAPARQLSPVLDVERLCRWIKSAPGLDISSYRLARGPDGRLEGFFGLWDQDSFKRLRVTGYSVRLRAVRTAVNAVAPVVGATPLPQVGSPLRYLTVVHPCVRGDDPSVLRALLLHAYDEFRGRGYSFFSLGLDLRDKLKSALSGLCAQPTDVHAYLTTPGGGYEGPIPADRPLYYEIGLV